MSGEESTPSRLERRPDALLDRPLPEGYRAQWAQHFAQPPVQLDDHLEGDERVVLIFRIGHEWFALPATIVQEVASPRRPHSLPHRRDKLVLGLVNVRGELLICVSLAALLAIDDGEDAESARARGFARMVVVGGPGGRAAFEVDEVHGLHRYAPRDIAETPATIGKSTVSLVSALIAWNDHAVGRLDGEMLLAALDRGIP